MTQLQELCVLSDGALARRHVQWTSDLTSYLPHSVEIGILVEDPCCVSGIDSLHNQWTNDLELTKLKSDCDWEFVQICDPGLLGPDLCSFVSNHCGWDAGSHLRICPFANDVQRCR